MNSDEYRDLSTTDYMALMNGISSFIISPICPSKKQFCKDIDVTNMTVDNWMTGTHRMNYRTYKWIETVIEEYKESGEHIA